MWQFYYYFLDKYVNGRDFVFEYIYINTESALWNQNYLYDKEVKNWLVTGKYSERTPDLFNPKFIGAEMFAVAAKSHICKGKQGTKCSCKNISKSKTTWLGNVVYKFYKGI